MLDKKRSLKGPEASGKMFANLLQMHGETQENTIKSISFKYDFELTNSSLADASLGFRSP